MFQVALVFVVAEGRRQVQVRALVAGAEERLADRAADARLGRVEEHEVVQQHAVVHVRRGAARSNTRFGTMSVMRQFVQGAGTDSGTLWISPLAGTVNGP